MSEPSEKPVENTNGDGATPQPAPKTVGIEPPSPPEAPPVASPIDPVEELRKRGKSVELAAVLAFLVPGMGHVYLGKRGKGLAAFVLIVGLFVSGLWLSGGEAVWLDREFGHPWAFCAQVGAGLPAGAGLLRSHAYEVKTMLGMKAEPPPTPGKALWTQPEYVAQLPHQDEGLLFTMVAGLLNLLLIHDAFCGAPGASTAREEDEDDDDDDEEENGG